MRGCDTRASSKAPSANRKETRLSGVSKVRAKLEIRQNAGNIERQKRWRAQEMENKHPPRKHSQKLRSQKQQQREQQQPLQMHMLSR